MKNDKTKPQNKIYEIKVEGTLDDSWSDWFSGVAISCADGVTTLRGKVMDQSVLRGMLTKIWDLNLTLISINQVNKSEDQSPSE